MKRHRVIIRLLVIWHVFIAVFSLFLYWVRIENRKHIPFEPPYFHEYSISLVDQAQEYAPDVFLILIVVLAISSGICLIVKKKWGRLLGMYLGGTLVIFGIILLVYNVRLVGRHSDSIVETLVELFTSMGATLGYIDFVCIIYGIFTIIYFKRPNVKHLLKQ